MFRLLMCVDVCVSVSVSVHNLITLSNCEITVWHASKHKIQLHE